MKKILFAIIAVFSMTAFAEDNFVKISAPSIDDAKAGGTVTLTVNLDKNFPISAFSFILNLPDGVTIAKKSHVVISEKRDPDEETAKTVMGAANGGTLISYVNTEGNEFAGNSGEIVSITLTIAEGVKEDIYKLNFSNISFSTPEGVAHLQEDFYSELGVGMKTAINAIEAASENENAPMYNLAGQRVSRVQKGIFIQNGKKVLK